MIVNYDIQKINTTLRDFYNATGINMELLRSDFSPVSSHEHWENNRYCKCIQDTVDGKTACRHSDAQLLNECMQSKEIRLHVCHAGLVDVAVPIMYNEAIIGYLLFGQIKTDAELAVTKAYIEALGLNFGEMQTLYDVIPFFDQGKIESLSKIAAILVKHILLENMLQPDFNESMQKAVNYITANFEKELSIHAIAKAANTSKSVLYRRFHAYFSCTPSEYINKLRIEKSMELLSKANRSVEEISQLVGFSSASYFSKTFKKQLGISPLQYKKAHSN